MAGLLNFNEMNTLFRMGMRILPTPAGVGTTGVNSISHTFMACSRFWLLFYAFWLLFMDMFFTIFPTTFLFVTLLTLLLHYTRIPTPPPQFVNALFGLDPNIIDMDLEPLTHQHHHDHHDHNDQKNSTYTSLFGSLPTAAFNHVTTAFQQGLTQAGQGLTQGSQGLTQGSQGLPKDILPLQKLQDAFKKSDKGGQLEEQLRRGQKMPQDILPMEKLEGVFKSGKNKVNDLELVEALRGFETPPPDLVLEQGFVSDLQDAPVPVIAHRGAGVDVPENCISAIQHCKHHHCHFVYLDVSLTQDGVSIVFHDEDLIRICGVNRKRRDLTWKELRGTDVSWCHHHGEKFRGERIPTLEQAVDKCIELNLKFFLNIVDTSVFLVDTICQTFRSRKLYSMAAVTSFHWKTIWAIRKRDPKIIGCLSFPLSQQHRLLEVDSHGHQAETTHHHHHHNNDHNPTGSTLLSLEIVEWFHQSYDSVMDWLLETFLWWYLGLSAVFIHKDGVSRSIIKEWGSRGIRCFLWLVNTPEEKLYLNDYLHVGYLTDTLVRDPVLHPVDLVHASSMILGHDPSRSIIHNNIHNNKNKQRNGNNKKTSTSASESPSMQSIPPSPPSMSSYPTPSQLQMLRELEKKRTLRFT